MAGALSYGEDIRRRRGADADLHRGAVDRRRAAVRVQDAAQHEGVILSNVRTSADGSRVCEGKVVLRPSCQLTAANRRRQILVDEVNPTSYMTTNA